jgi:glutamate 5-kinase
MELAYLREQTENVVECIDNDETASVICSLVHARFLIILTSVDGIYRIPGDPGTLVPAVEGKNADEILEQIDELSNSCVGASRAGANGARAKLDFIKQPIREGTTVYIANAQQRIRDILGGTARCTVFRVR